MKFIKYELRHCPVNPDYGYANNIVIPKIYTEIVSIGGGSTIDVGKWVARKYGLKHTAIPTTAGTGAEVTKYCVLTVHGKKRTFTDEAFIPDDFELRPDLVVTLPKLQTISTGMDALSQAFEAYWSKYATSESKVYSASAIDTILQWLPICVKEPTNLEARYRMLIAANLAGRAINIARTNICHAISYPLTEQYDVPHGIACAIPLKYFVKKFLGIDLTNLYKEIDFPKYKYDKEVIADIAFENDKVMDCPNINKEDIIKSL